MQKADVLGAMAQERPFAFIDIDYSDRVPSQIATDGGQYPRQELHKREGGTAPRPTMHLISINGELGAREKVRLPIVLAVP
jgi:hypothetical protein